MVELFREFLNDLIVYDYILFGLLLLFFLICIVFVVLLRKKVFLSSSIFILSFGVLLGGSTFGYGALHKYLYAHTLEIKESKKLVYSPAVVVRTTLTNNSKRDFSKCKIIVVLHKKHKYEFLDELYKLKPIAKMTIIEQDIDINSSRDTKFLITPFEYSGDFGVEARAKCR